MRSRFYFTGWVALALSFLNLSAAFAASQCPSPRAGYPALAFGMTGIGRDLCKRQLDRARWLGFTSVSMSPAFYMTSGGGVRPASELGELESCLNRAYELGFDIVYKPMIEAESRANASNTSISHPKTMQEVLLQAIDGSPEAPWRAKFEFSPTDDYKQKAIDPFMNWIESKRASDPSFKTFRGSIVVATELHRSVSEFPQAWNNLMWGLRSRLESEGLKYQIEIGIDPTIFGKELWLPSELKTSFTRDSCAQYQAMLWTADFFAPSAYGDYLAGGFTSNPTQAVEKIYDHVTTSWIDSVRSRGCKLTQAIIDRYNNADYKDRDKGRSTRRSWPGEIGYGGSLKRSYSQFDTDPPVYRSSDSSYPEKLKEFEETTFKTEQYNFVRNTPIWLKGVLDSSRGSYRNTINIWVTGRFDVFGFSDLPSLGDLDSKPGQYTGADPVRGPDVIPAVSQLRDLVRAYTAERCAGWQPMLPVAQAIPAAVKKAVPHRKKKKIIHVRSGGSATVTATPDQPLELEKDDSSEELIEDDTN
ncbi:unnamed protein product [Sphagnum jensenii]|uniref:Uncharacterized protein n=1 Tax=Sphagnum jensenii TaxID=128206 RepID=A0ABP0V742_9BRYO